MGLPATPWDALKALADELEHEFDTIARQHFIFNQQTGCWDTNDPVMEKWSVERQETIERIRDKAAEYYVEV